MKPLAFEIYKEAAMCVKKESTGQDQRIIRMIQHFSEESDLVLQEMVSCIATIEHQRNVIEAIYTMAGKALGKI
ncbi:hypothetical protein GC096_03705 [Paenibacillus sp. LMG 31461]|uniref:Uncharacterized protein n=1 Tax=Paenibacillus plantarum TaxID=2654975 RepID=A0ABX1X4V3_9BACL|nr:hypothetical protein [Paenibacillus plantarum]NOU63151.1 hypothetical protein [Paenibacillus plantarum]